MREITLNSTEIDQLASITGNAAASINLKCVDLVPDNMSAIREFLQREGAALNNLTLEKMFEGPPYHHDLTDVDFVALCPNLKSVRLLRYDIQATIFQHPTLENIFVEESFITATDETIVSAPVTKIDLREVNCRTTWRIESHPQIETFSYSLDEDYVERPPDALYFVNCPLLSRVYLHISDGWRVIFAGDLPQLGRIAAASQRYGDHEIDMQSVSDNSHPKLLALRDHTGHYVGRRFAFVDISRHTNMDKVRWIIPMLGGEIIDNLAEATDIIFGGDEPEASAADLWYEQDFLDDISNWY